MQQKAAELVKRDRAGARIIALAHREDDLAVFRTHTDRVAQALVR